MGFFGNLEFPQILIPIPKIPGNSGIKALVGIHIPIPNIPGNSGNNALVKIYIPIPNIPGNSGNENGNSHPFPFPWSSLG